MATELAFPGGSMTASGLRKEWARGRLAIERIAGKDYTTLAAIEEMRKLCRLDQKEPVSGSSLAAQRPNDRVVVKRLEGEEKTKGGIIIPDTVKEKPQEGKVIAVGRAGGTRTASSLPSTSRPATVFCSGSGREPRSRSATRSCSS
jgi:hypothetical protein